MTSDRLIRHFVTTGDHDVLHDSWPGDDILSKVHTADHLLRSALIAEVRRRSSNLSPPRLPAGFQAGPFTLSKVGPMVQGLFPARERPAILNLFKNALCFVTRDNIEQLLSETAWLSTTWQIANLYLGSLGLPGTNDQPVGFVGFSETTTIYCSMAYFHEQDPFADWVVHEAAHVFHNWKRSRAGLHSTCNQEFLLEIAVSRREVFAYACEAYDRILQQSPATRHQLLAQYARNHVPTCEDLDRAELVSILTEAVAARNGWKQILRRCSPQR